MPDALMPSALMTTYQPLPISLERGEGVHVWDTTGRQYLDASGGLAVCLLGHAHPFVTAAIQAQAASLIHSSNLYTIVHQERLGQVLTAVTQMDSAFFCNSGAEANECAIKLARLYGHGRNIELPTIVVMENAFHGRTLATVSATGRPKFQMGFEPLVPGFLRIPYNDIDALTQLTGNPNIVAVMLEPIQGEAGVIMPSPGYLKAVRAVCSQNNWLMIVDEIQAGLGRTGHFLAHQSAGISGDIVTLAKGLANGVPIGACLARGSVAPLFKPGQHGSTFGGNPLACRAALAVLETLEKESLIEKAAETGHYLQERLRKNLRGLAHVVDIRGQGLMIGIELDIPCRALLMQAAEKGLLINVANERVIRLLPALILTHAQADQISAILYDVIKGFAA